MESLHPHHPLHEPSIVTPLLTLAGLALQADLGDYSEERHRPHAGAVGYCKPTDYLPPHVSLLFASNTKTPATIQQKINIESIRQNLENFARKMGLPTNGMNVWNSYRKMTSSSTDFLKRLQILFVTENSWKLCKEKVIKFHGHVEVLCSLIRFFLLLPSLH